MSLFDIYKAKTLGAGEGSLFDAKAGGMLKDAWKKGFNKWDEQWEIAKVDWTAKKFTPNASGGRLATKNFIPVEPGKHYYLNVWEIDLVLYCYADEESNGSPSGGRDSDHAFIIPEGMHFVKFGVLTSEYGTTYKNDICFNISGEHNGEYVPYDGG